MMKSKVLFACFTLGSINIGMTSLLPFQDVLCNLGFCILNRLCMYVTQGMGERWGEFLPLVECYKIVFKLNGLNFSNYFELCRSTKTRSNYQYKIQTVSVSVLLIGNACLHNNRCN